MYGRILVPVDGSTTADKGLLAAVSLAKVTDAALCIVHIVEVMKHVTGFEPGEVYVHEALPHMREIGEQILGRARMQAEGAGIATETSMLESLDTDAWELILGQAAEWKADLIVIGTHGRKGMDRLMLGSDAEQVVRRATVPVLLVRTPEP